ncbi:MAG TPA: hypothetical protein VGJ22_04990 [Anaerolineales bacterium]|jgi:hypothetical protein
MPYLQNHFPLLNDRAHRAVAGRHDFASWMHNFPAHLAWLARDW